jgi:hypothetical protein
MKIIEYGVLAIGVLVVALHRAIVLSRIKVKSVYRKFRK